MSLLLTDALETGLILVFINCKPRVACLSPAKHKLATGFCWLLTLGLVLFAGADLDVSRPGTFGMHAAGAYFEYYSRFGLKPAGAVALCRLLRRSRRSGVGPGGPAGSSRRMSRSIAGGSDGLAGSPTITRVRLESDHE